MHFVNEQNSQELQISHLLRICLFTERDHGCRVLASAFTHKISEISTIDIQIPVGQTLPAAGLYIVVPARGREFCSCIHTQNQRNLYRWHLNSWRPDASCLLAAHRGARLLFLNSHTESAFSHTESAQSLPLASEFLSARCFLPQGCTLWVLGSCSCIHTQNQRNLYHWHPNS
jgi:hypothetical protein